MINFFGINEQQKLIEKKINTNLKKVLNHKNFILGEEVKDFEFKLEKYLKVKHCITCANGTEAISLVLKAWNIGFGDYVAVPAFTYVATAEAVRNVGAIPIFLDVNPDSFNVDKKEIINSLQFFKNNNLTIKAIIVVDLFGNPCDVRQFNKILKNNKIKLLVDGAQSTGSVYNDQNISSFADALTTSFFPTKPLGAYGDGGAVLTNDFILASKIRSLRVHGFKKQTNNYYQIGYNSRLDTIQAAILSPKLDILDSEITKRNEIANIYIENLDRNNFISQQITQNSVSAWAIYSIKCKNRDKAINMLNQNKIPYRIYYPKTVIENNAYKKFPKVKNTLKNSQKLSKSLVSLPMHPYLKKVEVKKICRILNNSI